MQDQGFSRNLDHLLEAVRLCRASQLYVPALVLAYAGIDILASLDPPEPSAGTRCRFVSWVERYLLPTSGLPCDAVDLYAARCGVVHTLGPESDLAAEAKARRLIYAFGDSSAEQIQRTIDEIGMPDGDIAVDVNVIFDAFERSVWIFRKAILNDSELRERVAKNSVKFFSGISVGHAFSFLDIRIG